MKDNMNNDNNTMMRVGDDSFVYPLGISLLMLALFIDTGNERLRNWKWGMRSGRRWRQKGSCCSRSLLPFCSTCDYTEWKMKAHANINTRITLGQTIDSHFPFDTYIRELIRN